MRASRRRSQTRAAPSRSRILTDRFDVVVVGGLGHVGLPLAVSLASAGQRVCALDINAQAAELIASGIVPFEEDGCEAALRGALDAGTFHVSLDEAHDLPDGRRHHRDRNADRPPPESRIRPDVGRARLGCGSPRRWPASRVT